jgi:hypothetical protein
MKIFILFAIFVNVISALAHPGIGSFIANGMEKHDFAQVEKYLHSSINATTTSSRLKYLEKATDSLRALKSFHRDRQDRAKERIFRLRLSSLNSSENPKADALVEEMEKRDKEFAAKLAELRAIEELALQGIVKNYLE